MTPGPSTIVGAILACVALLGACKDECDPKTYVARCEGNVRVSCPSPGVDQVVPIRIARDDCKATTCVSFDGGAVCALSTDPSPTCAGGDAGVSYRCESPTSMLKCDEGYATSRRDCLECDAGLCNGGLYANCIDDTDCAPSLQCKPGAGLCVPRDGGT